MIVTEASSVPSDHALMIVNEKKLTKLTSVDGTAEQISEKYYRYSYKTGELKALPDTFALVDLNLPATYSLFENIFTYITITPKKIVLSNYNLNTEEVKIAFASVTTEQFGAIEIRSSTPYQNRVYIGLEATETPMVAVIDIKNGELLYTGKVTVDGPESTLEESMSNIHLADIRLNHFLKNN